MMVKLQSLVRFQPWYGFTPILMRRNCEYSKLRKLWNNGVATDFTMARLGSLQDSVT